MPPRNEHKTTTRAPLSDYIRAHLARAGLSHNQLAKRSQDPDSGNRILVQWLIDMVNNRVSRAPELWRLRALAAAMATRDGGSVDMEAYRHHLDQVKLLAAAQWFDLPELLTVKASDGSHVEIEVPATLSPEKRWKIKALSEQMARDFNDEG